MYSMKCAVYILILCVTGVARGRLDLSVADFDLKDKRSSGGSGVLIQTPPLINAFAAPDGAMRDLAYDGEFLWAVNSGDGNSSFGPMIYKLDPDSGTVIESVPTVTTYPCGLAWDGQYLWHSVYLGGIIYRLEPATMTITPGFPAPTQMTFGLAWDGTFLYAVRGNEPCISVIGMDSGYVVDSIQATYSSPNVRPFGLVYLERGGTQLWTSDGNYGSNYVNAWNFGSGSWFDQWAATPTTYPCGLAHDSVTERLWVSCYDRDSIYVYDVSQTGISTGVITDVDVVSIEAFPNPFTQWISIRFTTQDPRYMIADQKLNIYDASGRLVKSFDPESCIPGLAPRSGAGMGHVSSVTWDGRDDENRVLGSGVYFIKIGQSNRTVKVVKLE